MTKSKVRSLPRPHLFCPIEVDIFGSLERIENKFSIVLVAKYNTGVPGSSPGRRTVNLWAVSSAPTSFAVGEPTEASALVEL